MKYTHRNLYGQFRHQTIGERIKEAMIKRRYAGNMPRVKKTILILFLLFINAYIYGRLAIDLAPYITAEASTTIIENWGARIQSEDVLSTTDATVTGDDGALVLPSQGIEGKIRDAWKGTGEESKAVFIAQCESGLDPNRIGDRHIAIKGTIGMSFGLFQIRHLEGRPDAEWLLNEDNNIEYARNLWEKNGGFENDWITCNKKYETLHLTQNEQQ